MKQQADVAIIGAGPLGLELAIVLKQMGVPYFQFDKGQVAQMIYQFPPQTQFFSSPERISIAGIPIQTINQQKCTREEYLAYIRSIVMAHQLKVNTFETVALIEHQSSAFILTTHSSKGEEKYKVRYLVLATGGTASPRRLGVPGEDLSHVSTKLIDPHLYFQKKVLIIGGKNSAIESALRCYHAGAKVSICTREPEFSTVFVKYWLLPELQSKIANREIDCYYQTEVSAITPDNVRLKKCDSYNFTDIQADFVIKAIGFDADMTLFQQVAAKLSIDQQSPIHNKDTMETTTPGVYVLGTAVGGTQQKFHVFIENTHVHVERIAKALAIQLKRPIPQKLLQPHSFKVKQLEE